MHVFACGRALKIKIKRAVNNLNNLLCVLALAAEYRPAVRLSGRSQV